jgi:glyoxylase-like metal-dependent hydrolase (beta-lactamase superfamily II)
MTICFAAGPGVDVIATTVDIPTLGSLTINSFVLDGTEPLLVDTGAVAGGADFLAALGSVIDPKALRWIWLTHTDFDHIGSLASLLELNPRIRVITSFLGVGIMGSRHGHPHIGPDQVGDDRLLIGARRRSGRLRRQAPPVAGYPALHDLQQPPAPRPRIHDEPVHRIPGPGA